MYKVSWNSNRNNYSCNNNNRMNIINMKNNSTNINSSNRVFVRLGMLIEVCDIG